MPRLSNAHFSSRKDNLALAPVQFHVKLAQGERQCSQCISNQNPTFLSTSSFVTNSVPWSTPVTCAPATVSPPAVNSPPCWAFTAPPSPTPTPNSNPKVLYKATSVVARLSAATATASKSRLPLRQF